MSIRPRCGYIAGMVALMAAMHPSISMAQEYLPPVIDRSIGADRAAAQGRAGAANAAPASPSIEERLVRIERFIDNQALIDMLMRLDTLQADSQSLRGEVEALNHEMDALKQRQRDLYLDIDTRLRKLEEAASRQAIAAPPVALTPIPAVAAPPQPADPAKEREHYQKAFNTLKDGQYEQAITEFQNFLSQYPAGDFSDNARYWLGEANYATRRYDVAIQEFRKLLEQKPDNSKASDAMLKLGYAYYELGQWDAARKTLTDVTARFANSTAARLAESRLQKMRLEGR